MRARNADAIWRAKVSCRHNDSAGACQNFLARGSHRHDGEIFDLTADCDNFLSLAQRYAKVVDDSPIIRECIAPRRLLSCYDEWQLANRQLLRRREESCVCRIGRDSADDDATFDHQWFETSALG